MGSSRERILTAAIKQIAARGWTASISDIAREAEVNEVTIYRHFGERENLLREMMVDASSRNPMPPYMMGLLAKPKVPALDVAMCHLVEIMLDPEAQSLYCLVYSAAVQRPDMLAGWDAGRSSRSLAVLLERYVRRLQAQKMLTRKVRSADAARTLHGILMGHFSRNVLLAGLENSDRDPVAAMRTLCRVVAKIP